MSFGSLGDGRYGSLGVPASGAEIVHSPTAVSGMEQYEARRRRPAPMPLNLRNFLLVGAGAYVGLKLLQALTSGRRANPNGPEMPDVLFRMSDVEAARDQLAREAARGGIHIHNNIAPLTTSDCSKGKTVTGPEPGRRRRRRSATKKITAAAKADLFRPPRQRPARAPFPDTRTGFRRPREPPAAAAGRPGFPETTAPARTHLTPGQLAPARRAAELAEAELGEHEQLTLEGLLP